jgi:hypothetical protein
VPGWARSLSVAGSQALLRSAGAHFGVARVSEVALVDLDGAYPAEARNKQCVALRGHFLDVIVESSLSNVDPVLCLSVSLYWRHLSFRLHVAAAGSDSGDHFRRTLQSSGERLR